MLIDTSPLGAMESNSKFEQFLYIACVGADEQREVQRLRNPALVVADHESSAANTSFCGGIDRLLTLRSPSA